ncbi:hypothetical protein [Pseudochelatococcus sp. G4_1912]|uniref:hypothetical protein n=1 Tax=Pseudochelatococcus sp. G4_1912 TaxID=3114288 RepID=UPI0039C5BAF5
MAGVVKVAWADDTLKRYANRLKTLNDRFPVILPRIINQVGNKAKTQVIRKLTGQTGLPRKTIVKAIGNPATARSNARLSYEMVTRGGYVRLKYLKPREMMPGVIARPFGKATLYPGAFMKGGAFPKRKFVDEFGGHIYRRLGYDNRRDGSRGDRITQVRSEMAIPNEMTTGATKAAFEKTAGPLLQERVEKVLATYTLKGLI